MESQIEPAMDRSQVSETDEPTTNWQPIKFHATGSEYFRIWIINLVLSIVTLGIYSAWATVRSRRYLYGNVEVADSRFDFHGKPIPILIGRIIAVILLLAWLQGDYFHYSVPLIALGIVVVFFPWFLTRGMSFKLRNTSFRNLRFNFHGSTRQGYRVLGAYLISAAVLVALTGYAFYSATLGVNPDDASEMDYGSAMIVFGAMTVLFLSFPILVPAFVCDLRRFTVSHSSYGGQLFGVSLSKGQFIGLFWVALLIFIASVIVVGAVSFRSLMDLIPAAEGESPGNPLALLVMAISFYFVFYFCFLLAQAFWQAKTYNLVFQTLALANIRFRSRMQVLPLAGILLTNTVLIILTLGFAYPWAKVRLMRYKLQVVEYQGDADEFSGTNEYDDAALGDEVGEAFNLDFGLGM